MIYIDGDYIHYRVYCTIKLYETTFHFMAKKWMVFEFIKKTFLINLQKLATKIPSQNQSTESAGMAFVKGANERN